MDSSTGKSLSDSSAGGADCSKGYTHYVLGILTVVYVSNFIDRQIFAILAQSIKTDLELSDLEIGALSGMAFGIFYATWAFPLAHFLVVAGPTDWDGRMSAGLCGYPP